MKYPDKKCDYTGEMGANHTEPMPLEGKVCTAYLSDKAYDIMMMYNGMIRSGDESAVHPLTEFWSEVARNVRKREP